MFDKTSFKISGKLYAGIAEYIDDNYAFEHSDRRHRRIAQLESSRVFEDTLADCMCAPKEIGSLEEALGMIDESFASMVLRKIDEKGMSYRRRMERIEAIIDLHGATAHIFRHSYLIYAASLGTDLKTLQSIAGHADIQTTINRYVHKQTDKISETGNRLQTLFG